MQYSMATIVLFFLCVVGCAQQTSSKDTAETTEETAENVDATAVYMTYCSGCHASDGTGAAGPDLTTSIPNLSDSELMDVLQNGIDSMAAPSLTEPEEDALFLYLRERFGEYGSA